MEIERKFLVKKLPDNLSEYEYKDIEQAYLCTEPVVRIRKSNDKYTLTYKSKGFLAREEYNLPLTKEAYLHLRQKADGNIISKRRYIIPLDLKHNIELDIFNAPFSELILAEVEFESTNDADAFIIPDWFLKEVTYDTKYHNSFLSMAKTKG